MPMHKYFADWYRETRIEPDPDVLERRWEGVAAHQKGLDEHSAARLVRLAYHRPVDDHDKDKVREPFQGADPSFPMRNNDQELAVLAAATIASSLEENAGAATHLSLLVRTCDLAGHKPVIRDVAEAAADYIATQGQAVRRVVTQGRAGSIDPEKISEAFEALSEKGAPNQNAAAEFEQAGEALKTVLTGIDTTLKRSFDYARCLASVHQEQIDVLWWLFGQRARARAQGVSTQGFPVVVGYSIAENLLRWPPPQSCEAFIERALLDSDIDPSNTVTFAEAVDAVLASQTDIPMPMQTAPERLADLLPLHSAFQVAADVGDQWQKAMKQRTGLGAEVAHTNSSLAQLALCEAGAVATSQSS